MQEHLTLIQNLKHRQFYHEMFLYILSAPYVHCFTPAIISVDSVHLTQTAPA